MSTNSPSLRYLATLVLSSRLGVTVAARFSAWRDRRPQGEYANPSTQDGIEIAAIGDKHVRIFKFGARPSLSATSELPGTPPELSETD